MCGVIAGHFFLDHHAMECLLALHAPQCSRCHKPMKVRTLLLGLDDVSYR
jgi:hypothetical protein